MKNSTKLSKKQLLSFTNHYCKSLFFCFIIFTFNSCSKTELQLTDAEKTAETLKTIITEKKITSIIVLCKNCGLSNTTSSPGWGGAHIFKGGYIHINDYGRGYNLANLQWYETDNNSRLGLNFEP